MSLTTYRKRMEYKQIAQELEVSLSSIKKYFAGEITWTALEKKIAKHVVKVQLQELSWLIED